MRELKSGCLALIIDSNKQSDIGKCVTTVELVAARGSFKSPHGRQTVNCSDCACWLVTGDVKSEMGKESPVWSGNGWSLYPPQYLMPIDGDDFSDELISDKEKSHA
ncbi:hypothetical protein [Kosakonia cowanii]|uniref:hypothetical protein n=1 Tax=Kosakonia cowanii TaxID=208223 RepID=UPI0028982109|nr:hypothetical protein [Kosakonia cowanii]